MFCEKMRRSASFDVRYGKHVKIIADGDDRRHTARTRAENIRKAKAAAPMVSARPLLYIFSKKVHFYGMKNIDRFPPF